MGVKAAELRRLFEDYSLSTYFPESQDESLTLFLDHMLLLNETLNLTKWTSLSEVLTHHVLDSAFGVPLIAALKPKSGEKWMDLGTGGGFPGVLVLAAFPQTRLYFLDAVAKKARAVEQCLAAAGWSAEILAERAEALGRDPKTREGFDGVVARAVADLPVLLEYAVPLLKPGGHLLNWMTADQIEKVDKSQKALAALQARIVESREYRLPNLDQSRFILLVEKLGTTDPRYPRAVGQPSKRPLI
ncbi:MAG TPA: 16S rRNA (guanine(527)-N(7))-methyltransferase RsmG [bacterium]|nr:16S rRNA (guanine(527)-N(7))-methyltransferase RsmG [bacterium]